MIYIHSSLHIHGHQFYVMGIKNPKYWLNGTPKQYKKETDSFPLSFNVSDSNLKSPVKKDSLN